MKWITPVQITPPPLPLLSYDHHFLIIGSCFSEHIGDQISIHGLPCIINPTGIMYNPISIARTITYIEENKQFTKDDLFFHNEFWHSFDVHGDYSQRDVDTTLEIMNGSISNTQQHLFSKKTRPILIITFGTAWIYTHKETGQIVANCHKVPDHHFTRKRLSRDEILNTWSTLLERMISLLPEMKVLFAVSPIRHLKDGLHENNLSKATLLLSIEELVHQFPEHCSYFPSYEIILDELRDYRFYTEDLCHINTIGIQYVWEKFVEIHASKATKNIMEDIQRYTNFAKHRPLKEDAKSIHALNIQKKALFSELEKKYPTIDLGNLRM